MEIIITGYHASQPQPRRGIRTEETPSEYTCRILEFDESAEVASGVAKFEAEEDRGEP